MGDIADTYNSDPLREWVRLERDAYHSVEFLTTMHHLRAHLEPGSRILDAGGGPGRYALQLCREGHSVVLYDAGSELVRLATEKMADEPDSVQERLLDALVGDVRDMGALSTGQFDAVICLGPLTHIANESERLAALREIVRVCRPGGLVGLSVGGYLAMLRTVVGRFSHELLNDASWERMARGESLVTGMTWHFFRADELRRLAESAGLSTLALVGCQGVVTGLSEATNDIATDPAKWSRLQPLILTLSVDPTLVDLSEHILYLGRTPT